MPTASIIPDKFGRKNDEIYFDNRGLSLGLCPRENYQWQVYCAELQRRRPSVNPPNQRCERDENRECPGNWDLLFGIWLRYHKHARSE